MPAPSMREAVWVYCICSAAVRHAIIELFARLAPQQCRIVENGSAESNGVSKSAKVVTSVPEPERNAVIRQKPVLHSVRTVRWPPRRGREARERRRRRGRSPLSRRDAALTLCREQQARSRQARALQPDSPIQRAPDQGCSALGL